MANLSITAANVLSSLGLGLPYGVAGATITAGQVLYLDSVTNTLKLADANASAATAAAVGIAAHGAYAAQRLSYVAVDSLFTPGGTMTVGQRYFLSATAGAICPSST